VIPLGTKLYANPSACHFGGRWVGSRLGARSRSGLFPIASLGAYGSSRSRLTTGIDPRVAADGVRQQDLEEQLDLNLKLRDGMRDARG
jgi:hypothetical protein